MLHLRNHSLSELFKETPKDWFVSGVSCLGQDECVEKLNQVVCEYEHMWTKTLGEMTTSVGAYTLAGPSRA